MNFKNKRISCFQLFETYDEAYQPYISPVIQELKQSEMFDVSVVAFNNHGTVDRFIPSYKKRFFNEKWYALIHNSKLNYLEILCVAQKTAIVHIQQSFLFPKVLNLLKLPTDSSPKIVITLRGSDTYIKPWYMQKWQEFYMDNGHLVDAFVVMSEHQKKYLHNKWRIALNRIHVIPISFGKPFKVLEKRPTPSIMKVVSAFRMCWEKNIEGNLRVIKLLKELGVPVQYDLYGDGTDKGQVHYLIDKYDLINSVSYHGRLDNEVLLGRLPSSDFFLQLSHSESLGMSVIEAQALGLPAIVSNSDGLPEVIQHNKTGYCVDPHDAESAALHLVYLWQHSDVYMEFSKEAIRYSHQNFSIDREVNALKLLYSNLLNA